MSHVPEIALPYPAVRRTAPPLVYHLLVLIAVGTYILLASYRLTGVPLGYDELLFCNAALGCIDPDLFAFVKIGHFPVLLMDYIGALKAWLYYPIFKLFGVSVWSIRFPMVLLNAVGLVALAGIVRRDTNWRFALLLTAYTAVDASFSYYTRIDTGPNAIELFLKIGTIWGLMRFAATGQVRYAVVIGVALLLGLFNKLNFIWYVNAFYAGLVVAYGGTLWQRFRRLTRLRQAQWLLVLGGTYLLSVLYLVLANHYFDVFGQKVGNEKGLAQPFFRVFDLFKDVVTGSGVMVYSYRFGFTGWPQWAYALQPYVATLLLGTSVLTTAWLVLRSWLARRFPEKHQLFIFSTVVLLALLAQMFVTERARYGWHIFAVYPFATLSGLYAIRLLWSWVPASVRVRQVGTWATLGLLLGLMLATEYFTLRGLRRQAFQYEAAIGELIQYAQPMNQKFVIVGGACTTQLITMTQQPDKYYELAYLFNVTHKFLTIRARNHDEFYQKYLTQPGAYYFIDSTKPLPRGSVINYRDYHCRPFLDVVAEHGVTVEVVKEIDGPQDGYRIYRVVR